MSKADKIPALAKLLIYSEKNLYRRHSDSDKCYKETTQDKTQGDRLEELVVGFFSQSAEGSFQKGAKTSRKPENESAASISEEGPQEQRPCGRSKPGSV